MHGAALRDRIDAVVIGASAGGIEAVSLLLAALPAQMKATVFVVLHLPRERPSLLAGLFAPLCAVPVREADDKEPVEPGCVYLAPPDYHLLLDKGPRIALSADDAVNHSRPSIDPLFESAADCYGARLAGVILTGANADGAAGLAAVRRAGGLCIVQVPASALASAMPAAALQCVEPDFVLPLDGIAELLRGLVYEERNLPT